MTEKEILEESINIAENNGYRINSPFVYYFKNKGICLKEQAIEILQKDIIFSHEFAQAFWPDNEEDTFIKSDIKELVVFEKQKSSWRFHLKQMVLEENPLKYLEKFL